MSANLNLVCISGNLTRDPELRFTNDGTEVANFSVAVNGFKDNDTSFVRVTVWGKTAKICSEYLAKGRKVNIQGRLTTDKWTTKKGENRVELVVTASFVEFLTPAGDQVNQPANSPPPPTDSGSIPF